MSHLARLNVLQGGEAKTAWCVPSRIWASILDQVALSARSVGFVCTVSSIEHLAPRAVQTESTPSGRAGPLKRYRRLMLWHCCRRKSTVTCLPSYQMPSARAGPQGPTGGVWCGLVVALVSGIFGADI